MKTLSLLLIFQLFFCQSKAQDLKEQQRLKNITLQAYESTSQSTRQWFADVTGRHPAGDFDTAYAKQKLQERYNVAQLTNMGDLLMVMMAYQKMLAKEARDDRKMQTDLRRLMLAGKTEKIKLDNQAIDRGMQEAKEKAEIAMNAATVSLVTGIVSGSIQVAAASMSFQDKQITSKKDSAKPKIRITQRQGVPVKQLSLAHYINKLEGQLAILKKEKN